MDNQIFQRNLSEHIDLSQKLYSLQKSVVSASRVIVSALLSGNTVFFCGNGGSATDAQHMAAELSGRYLKEREPLNAFALHTNSSALTAIANDYGFGEVYARQLQAHAKRGDVLVAISTSGDSENIVRAAEKGRSRGMYIIALTGETGGILAKYCDILLAVPSNFTPRIQEMHILIGHILCEMIESNFEGI